MSKKDEFVALAEKVGIPPQDLEHWREKNLKAFVAKFNEDGPVFAELRKAFREAVAEAEEEKRNSAAGLANLFGGP